MQQWYKCPQCSQDILYGTNPCPHCNCSLAWSQQGPVVYVPPIGVPHTVAQPETPTVPVVRGGGGINCVNCGNIMLPVKSKFGCGWFILFGIFYLIYYAGKSADTCPICGKNAFKRTDEPLVK